jgi:hypothetical protein
MALTLDGTNGIVSSGSITTQSATGVIFSDSSSLPAASSPNVLKNRIINGAMVIDQRNAGASGTALSYTVDRFFYDASQASKGTWQQNAGSVTPPTGFTNYLGFTSSSAYSISAGDYFIFGQYIEGYNVADLDFGKATAKTVTLSFWVRSSLTGTFGGALVNAAANRSYAFSYSIPTANTWTQISVTVAGDTTGTWLTTNNLGLMVRFGLGVGTTYSGTAGAWAATQYLSATGATSVVGTNGATWYVTGVQLEQNTSATPFERRQFGNELALCQRYFAKLQNDGSGGDCAIGFGFQTQTTSSLFGVNFPVTMRTEPTATISNLAASDGVTFTNTITLASANLGYNTGTIVGTFTAAGAQFRPSALFINVNTAGFLALSAEL